MAYGLKASSCDPSKRGDFGLLEALAKNSIIW